jgi:hypothetical protein
VLSDSLGYQALNARAAKSSLTQRTQILEDSQAASKAAITKRRNVERLKGSSSINPSKVDDAISEMDEVSWDRSVGLRRLTGRRTSWKRHYQSDSRRSRRTCMWRSANTRGRHMKMSHWRCWRTHA